MALFSGVMRVTGRPWGAGGDIRVEAIRERTAAHLGQVGPALAKNWHSG